VDDQAVSAHHRASYILERGVWSARCRVCGFTAKEVKRSAAATSFLAHIRATRLELRNDEVDSIDLDALTSHPASPPRGIGTQGEIDLRRMAAGGSRQSAGH
jgi:hypothetical protein